MIQACINPKSRQKSSTYKIVARFYHTYYTSYKAYVKSRQPNGSKREILCAKIYNRSPSDFTVMFLMCLTPM
jgi:hypothetical protein